MARRIRQEEFSVDHSLLALFIVAYSHPIEWSVAGSRANPDRAQKIVIGHFGFLVTSKFDIWAKRGATVLQS
jgi:hypothetical protein